MGKMPGACTALIAAALLGSTALHAQDAAPEPTYAEATAATAPVADAYFAAYIARDWDALEPLLADDGSFQDPTATRVFGSVAAEGRAAVMERFRKGYVGITHMQFATTRRMMSGDVAIYEGALDWGLALQGGAMVQSVTPMVIVLTVRNGKIASHRDYVDYAPFLAAYRAAKAAKAQS